MHHYICMHTHTYLRRCVEPGRGGLARHLLVVLPGALVGAIVGTAFSLRIAAPIRIGDVGLVWASAGAWAGIVGASLLARIVQVRRARPT